VGGIVASISLHLPRDAELIRTEISMDGPHCEERLFRVAWSKFPTGVAVMTVRGLDKLPYGITISSFTAVSFVPPLVLVCVDCRSQMAKHLRPGHYFAVNILSEEQKAVSSQFSRNWQKRFTTMDWYPGKTGAPLLPHVVASLECAFAEIISAGDHIIAMGRVLHAELGDRAPLVYVNGTYARVKIEAEAGTEYLLTRSQTDQSM
jgi:flavin reductase (DIM6/NTAB) family NADH-FMN oxidoreductase RutF